MCIMNIPQIILEKMKLCKRKLRKPAKTVLKEPSKKSNAQKQSALDRFTKIYQSISAAPLLWDSKNQKFIYCQNTIIWKLSSVLGMSVIFLMYVWGLVNRGGKNSLIFIPTLNLLVNWCSIFQCIFTISVSMSLINHGKEFSHGFNMLKKFEEDLVKSKYIY